nr:MAG TPA: hypothetical protein [Caudoviricetes sp.]
MIIDAKITWFRRSLLLFISAQNINFVYHLNCQVAAITI